MKYDRGKIGYIFCRYDIHHVDLGDVDLGELLEMFTVMSTGALDCPCFLELGDFSVPSDAFETGVAQDFMSAMEIMGLP